jgi:hypothetical protein
MEREPCPRPCSHPTNRRRAGPRSVAVRSQRNAVRSLPSGLCVSCPAVTVVPDWHRAAAGGAIGLATWRAQVCAGAPGHPEGRGVGRGAGSRSGPMIPCSSGQPALVGSAAVGGVSGHRESYRVYAVGIKPYTV